MVAALDESTAKNSATSHMSSIRAHSALNMDGRML
jgi:hypothetical protein